MNFSVLSALVMSAVISFGSFQPVQLLAQEPGVQNVPIDDGALSSANVPVGDGALSTNDGDPDTIGEKLDAVTEQVNTSGAAQDATENILTPIREIGEVIVGIPGFYWIAFAMMAAGFVSFLLQLVLGKLIMLARFHFSLTEIMSDTLGLLVSSIGLVLLTQAATSTGHLTNSPAAVLSASIVGAFFGLIFYFRGQTQELREARALRAGRKG